MRYIQNIVLFLREAIYKQQFTDNPF